MRRKKQLQDRSRDERIPFGQKLEEHRQRRKARRRERRLWLKTARSFETCSMLDEGLGDDAPDALISSLLRDEPALSMVGRDKQKGCWV